MTQTISPISAAQHYATAAGFWENHAKALQHRLDEALARVADLEREAEPPPDPDPEAEPQTAS